MENTPNKVNELKLQAEYALANNFIVDIETLKGYQVTGTIAAINMQGRFHEITYNTQFLGGKKLFLEHIKTIHICDVQ